MKLKNFILSSFLAVATSVSAAHAADKVDVPTRSEQSISQNTVTLYGHDLDPASVKIDDTEGLIPWSELEPLVPGLFEDGVEEVSVEEMCTRIFMRHDQYRDAVEPRREALIAKFAEIYYGEYEGDRKNFPQDIVGRIASPSMDGVNELIEAYPRAEDALIKIREVTFGWMGLERLHDAAIEKCPEFAGKIERTPILSYEAPVVIEQPSPAVSDGPKR